MILKSHFSMPPFPSMLKLKKILSLFTGMPFKTVIISFFTRAQKIFCHGHH